MTKASKRIFAKTLLTALAGASAQAGTISPGPDDLRFFFTDGSWFDESPTKVPGQVTGTFFGTDGDGDGIIDLFELSFFEATWLPTGASPIPGASWDEFDLSLFNAGSSFEFNLSTRHLMLSTTNPGMITYSASTSAGSQLISSSATIESSGSLSIGSHSVPASGSTLVMLLAGLAGTGLLKRQSALGSAPHPRGS